jgi:hypothetical protein
MSLVSSEVRHTHTVGLLHLQPERQVVAVVITVVVAAALLHHQTARVGAVAAGVPAARPGAAAELLQLLRGLRDVLALGGLGHVLVVDPAQAVVGDFVAARQEGLHQFGVALQCRDDAKHGQWQLALVKFTQDAPHPCA